MLKCTPNSGICKAASPLLSVPSPAFARMKTEAQVDELPPDTHGVDLCWFNPDNSNSLPPLLTHAVVSHQFSPGFLHLLQWLFIFSCITVSWHSLCVVILVFSLFLVFLSFLAFKIAKPKQPQPTCFGFAVTYQKDVLADACVLYYPSSLTGQRLLAKLVDFANVGQFQIAARFIMQYYFFMLFYNVFLLSLPFPSPSTCLSFPISFKEERSIILSVWISPNIAPSFACRNSKLTVWCYCSNLCLSLPIFGDTICVWPRAACVN